jgi:hypothetical protein
MNPKEEPRAEDATANTSRKERRLRQMRAMILRPLLKRRGVLRAMSPEGRRRFHVRAKILRSWLKLRSVLAAMTPEQRRRFRKRARILRALWTLPGFLGALLAIAVFIALLGLGPHLDHILGSPQGRQSFLSQLPFLLVFPLAGGLAAIALGAMTAVVGGRIVIFLANLRSKSVR